MKKIYTIISYLDNTNGQIDESIKCDVIENIEHIIENEDGKFELMNSDMSLIWDKPFNSIKELVKTHFSGLQ